MSPRARQTALRRLGRVAHLSLLAPVLLAPLLSARPSPRIVPAADTIRFEFPDTTDPPRYRRSSEPLLSIGELEGAEPYLLDGVTDIDLLVDGRVRIASSRGREVREFDGAGRYVRTFGRAGRGPGEFERIQAIQSAGDSLLVAADHRVTVFDEGGSVRSTHPLPPMEVIGFLEGGEVVGYSGASVNVLQAPTGPNAVSALVVVADWIEGVVDTIASTAMRRAWVTRTAGAGTVTGIPFTPTSSFAVRGERLAFGAQGEPAVTVVSAGRPRWHLRWPRDPRPVTSADVEALVTALPPDQQPERRRQLSEMPIPEVKPYFQGIALSDHGDVWVADPGIPRDDGTLWLVFDPDSRTAGYMRTPPDFRLLSVRGGRLAGVHRGELDVQRVLVFGLERGDGG